MGKHDRDLLSLPFSRQDLLPRGKRDRTLYIIMLIAIPTVFIFDIYYVLPHVSNLQFIHMPVAFFIMFNVAGNMIRLLWSQPTVRALPIGSLPSVLYPDWFYCHDCRLNVPPRSYHCRVCDVCILKQNHHCMFAGKCVGFGNQRFFVIGVTYILVGVIYSLIMHVNFTFASLMGGYRWSLIFCQMFPHLGWFFGYLTFSGFLAGILNLLEVCAGAFCATLLYAQVGCISKNQTMRERQHDVSKFTHPTLEDNIEEVFGKRYFLVWLWPMMESPPRGDGIHFECSTVEENRKNR